jgi:uncharacterized membrane protein YsdA (DUF1294 family)
MTTVSYLSLTIVMSCVSFVLYGLDKRRATTGGRRVPERTLHLLAFLGGWPGGLLGQQYFRHKTKKAPFLIGFWLIVCLHVCIVGAIIYAMSVLSSTTAVGSRQAVPWIAFDPGSISAGPPFFDHISWSFYKCRT